MQLQNATLSRREEYGLAVAALGALQRKGRMWIVPSQFGRSRYTVRPYRKVPQCTCADFRENGGRCKHILAVEAAITRSETSIRDEWDELVARKGAEMRRQQQTYPQVWPAYNAAQTSEKREFQILLADLCKSVEPTQQQRGRGRPRVLLSDAIFAMVYKVYSGLSARRFHTDLEDACARGLIKKVPHFNSLLLYMRKRTLAPILRDLIVAASRPFVPLEEIFAVDSTGFSARRYAVWEEMRKWPDKRREHTWRKAHLACGVVSNVITAIEILSDRSTDTKQLPSLISRTKKTGFNVREVVADKGYLALSNYNFVDQVGGTAYIKFKNNSTGTGGRNRHERTEVWEKAHDTFKLHRSVFDRHYHKRSNVEATMSMIKRKFGNSVLSKSDAGMNNEIYCKALCHNICCVIQAMHEIGVTPDFGITGASEPMRHISTPERSVIQ